MENIEIEQTEIANSIDNNSVQNILEQQTETLLDPNGGKPNNENEKEVEVCSNTIGKFKSVDDLFKAYTELEKEFTKRSQKLSELSREHSDNASAPEPDQEWKNTIENFMSENPLAQKFSEEILNRLNGEKSKNIDSLNKAFQNVVNEKFVDREQIVKDSEFVENYVLNNDYITKNVIENYLNGLLNKQAPQVISGTKGAGFTLTKTELPTSLEEASKLAKKLME